MKEEYWTAKENMADIVETNWEFRKKCIANIARLYDDAMPSKWDTADRMVGEIHFHYMIWKYFGGLPDYRRNWIRQIADTVLSANSDFFELKPDEYADLIQLTKELLTADIPVLTDDDLMRSD